MTFIFHGSIQCQEDLVALCGHLERTSTNQDPAPVLPGEEKIKSVFMLLKLKTKKKRPAVKRNRQRYCVAFCV